MRHVNIGLCSKSWAILLLLSTIDLTLIVSVAQPAPSIVELRSIIAKKSLRPPSAKLLAALDTNHLATGLLAIDPYARYVPPPFYPGNSSSSFHLGMEVFAYKSRLWIRSDPNGPADQAGIPEIGLLLAINNINVENDNLSRISSLLDRAVQEERVILTVSTSPESKGKNYKIMPVPYRPSSITWNRIGTDIIVRIRNFVSHDTAPSLSALCTTLVRPGTRVVIDLRGCSGGDFYESLDVAGLFVPAGRRLASTYNRTGVVKTYRAPQGKKLSNPVWLLIDSRTASAAEIIVGILQYYKLAHVAGEQSFGKFVSQTIFPLSEGGELWLTTLAIRLPDNISRVGKGIKPDIYYPDISVTKVSDIIKTISNDFSIPH